MDRPPLKALPGIIGSKAAGILVGVGKGAVEQILERNYRGSSEELLQTEGKRRLVSAAKLIGLGSLRLFVADEEDRKEAFGELLDIFLHTVWVKQSSQSLPDTHDRVVVAREVAANVPALALTELKTELGKVHIATEPGVKAAHELSCPNVKGKPVVVTTLAEAVAEGHEWCPLCLASVGATMASAKLLWASTPASAVVNSAAAAQPVESQPATQTPTPAPAAASTPAPAPTTATPVTPAAAPEDEEEQERSKLDLSPTISFFKGLTAKVNARREARKAGKKGAN